MLRSRLRELESLVGDVEGRGREEENLGEPLEVERSLAMLTAQYEKARDCDLEEELNCSLPSGVSVPLGSGSTLTSHKLSIPIAAGRGAPANGLAEQCRPR